MKPLFAFMVAGAALAAVAASFHPRPAGVWLDQDGAAHVVAPGRALVCSGPAFVDECLEVAR